MRRNNPCAVRIGHSLPIWGVLERLVADVNVSDPPSCCGSNYCLGSFPTILWRGALHPLTPSTPRDSSNIRVIAPLGWPNSTHETNDTVGGFGCFLTVKYNTPRARGVWCVFSTSKSISLEFVYMPGCCFCILFCSPIRFLAPRNVSPLKITRLVLLCRLFLV